MNYEDEELYESLDVHELENEEEEVERDNEQDGDWMDGDALASAGFGTDEDYGYYGDDF